MAQAVGGASLFVVLLGLLFPTEAYAYLDPGTGSLVLQGIIAGLAAAAYAVRTNWDRLAGLFRGSRSPQEPGGQS